jgi:hypothetical protein
MSIAADLTLGKDDPTLAGAVSADGKPIGLRDYTVGLELREAAAVGKPWQYIEGRAVPYGEWTAVGYFMEQHAPASLKQSTTVGRGRSAPLLLFHDNRSFPIGVVDHWDQRDDGLDGRWRLNESPEAQRAAAAADRGELTGLSIGFQPIRSRWELLPWEEWDPDAGPDGMDKVTREESVLVEVSVTPTPAFAGAQIDAVRSIGRAVLTDRDVVVDLRTRELGGRPEPEAVRYRRIYEELRSGQR